MSLADVIMLAGDTMRSRYYLSGMESAGILPRAILLLPGKNRPGQLSKTGMPHVSVPWGRFDPGVTVEEYAKRMDLAVHIAPSGDVNDPVTVEFLRTNSDQTAIYSGFGGVILRKAVLGVGVRFLHVHGGWLPDYKGSTTNYYSLLEENQCGASAIFLDQRIDQGAILLRRKFPPPSNVLELDFIWDNVYRTQVLIEVLEHYRQFKSWPRSGVVNTDSPPYYIMHPILRHVVIERGK